MTISNQEDYIKYRFYRAEESFDEAIILAEKDKWNAVVNRLYYSCFYAVIALLIKNGIETQTHDGARTQFAYHFIKTNLVDKKFGRHLSKMFDFRQKGDYGDLFNFDKESVIPLMDQTKEFITVIRKLVFD